MNGRLDSGPDGVWEAPNGSSRTRTTNGDVRAQLTRVLDSPDFNASARRRAFLSYIVDETLDGRADRLKGYTIGLAVFDRDDSFDPQTDPVVRLEAGRLRRDLERYYLTAGRDDPIVITVPKGAYVPVFTPAARPEPPARPVPHWRARLARHPRLTIGAAAAMAGAALVLPALYLAVPSSDGFGPARLAADPAIAMPRGASVAVIPFRNLSGDSGQDFFADGMFEQIVTDLTRFKGMYVLSPGSTRRYRDEAVDHRDIRDDLGVDYFLSGGVRRSESRVLITVRLVSTRSGRVVWADGYDRELAPDKILEVQGEISQRVAASIGSGYGAIARSDLASSNRKPPTSMDAYDCVLHYYHYDVSGVPEEHAAMRDCLEEAVEIDPGYGEAWALLSTIYADEHRFGFNPRPDLYVAKDKALEAAKRAVAVNPNSATAHIMLADAYFNVHDLDSFRREGERSLALNPNNPHLVSNYGLRLAFIGEWDRGLALMRKAIAMNPDYPGWYRFPFVLYHYERGEYAKALSQVRKINMPEFYWSHMTAAMTLGQMGRERDASESVGKLLRLKPDFGQQVYATLRIWNLPQPLIDRIEEGLRKAGLAITPLEARS